MKKFQIKHLGNYLVEIILEKHNLNKNDNFSELKRRLKVEVYARLALIPIGITFTSLVNAIIDQIEINNIINNT